MHLGTINPRRGRKVLAGVLLAVLAFTLAGCTNPELHPAEFEASLRARRAELVARTPSTGQIHLFGERHGTAAHLNKQFELWHDFYTNHDMRHLFLEMPFFTAEFLNMWMRADDDYFFDAVFADLRGTLAYNAHTKGFLRRIKTYLPETVFHGTDVGHQYWSTGARFISFLRDNGYEGSEKYYSALENIRQGEMYYDYNMNVSIRADMMVNNFLRIFDDLGDESIMSALYGAQHVAFGRYSRSGGRGPTMASQLRERYGENLHATMLRDGATGARWP